MADLQDFIGESDAGDAVGNDARMQAAFAQAGLDGYLRVPPYLIAIANADGPRWLPGHVQLWGEGEGDAGSVIMNINPVSPHIQLGVPGVTSEDGGILNICLMRPESPLFSTAPNTPGATPCILPAGSVARAKLRNITARNAGRFLVFKNNGGTCFGWDIEGCILTGPGSQIYIERAFGTHIRNCRFSCARPNGDKHFQAALVEIVGEVDGLDMGDRCVADTAAYGLLWAHSSTNVTGVNIEPSCWADKPSMAGAWIAPQGTGGLFYDFDISLRVWGGSTSDNVPGCASGLVMETRREDDIREGRVLVKSTNVRAAAIFMADRSASGSAGRVRALQLAARSFNGGAGQGVAVVEFAGTRHKDCSVMYAEGSGYHSAAIGTYGAGTNFYQGGPCRLVAA